MMPDVCERLVLVPGRFSSYQSIGHTSLHTSQCNAQMKISFPGLIFAQYKSINIIIIIIIIITIIIIRYFSSRHEKDIRYKVDRA